MQKKKQTYRSRAVALKLKLKNLKNFEVIT